MVSVTAVNIQLSSPNGVRLSDVRPGSLSTISIVILLVSSGLRITTHRSDISIGVVRHAVKTSAGKSGFIGKVSFGPHAASCIQSRQAEDIRVVCCCWAANASASRCSANRLNALTIFPADEQSHTYITGEPSHDWRSKSETGIYCV